MQARGTILTLLHLIVEGDDRMRDLMIALDLDGPHAIHCIGAADAQRRHLVARVHHQSAAQKVGVNRVTAPTRWRLADGSEHAVCNRLTSKRTHCTIVTPPVFGMGDC